MVLHICPFLSKADTKGPRPDPLRQKEKEGKDPDAYDKMNALGLVRMEVALSTLYDHPSRVLY